MSVPDAWRFLKWARSVEGLTPAEAKVLCHVAGKIWAGDGVSPRGWQPGRCSMSRETIAAACQVSTRTVKRAVKNLEQRGLLVREFRYWHGKGKISDNPGRQIVNVYSLPEHVIAAAAALKGSQSYMGVEQKSLSFLW